MDALPTAVARAELAASQVHHLLAVYPQRSNITEREHVHEVWNIPKTPDPNVIYSIDNAFYEPVDNLLAARNLLRQSFVLNDRA